MATYIINVEASSPDTYEKVHEVIKSFNGWARITNSLWAVITEKKATEIRNQIAQSLQESDRLFVIRSGTESAWRNARSTSEWLKKHL